MQTKNKPNAFKKSRVKEQAKYLTGENREADHEISPIYWFSRENESRLVELHKSVPPIDDGEIHPFYFPAMPAENLFCVSAIALIRPEEFGKLKLPDSWGSWKKAVKMGNGR